LGTISWDTQPRPESPAPLKIPELSEVEQEVGEITRKLERERQTREGIGRFLKHPVTVLTESPANILFVCISLSPIVFIWGFVAMVRSYGIQVLFNSTVVDDFAVFAVLLSIVPVAIFDLKENWRVKNLENALPNFFRDLPGMNDSGMTLPNAVHLVAGQMSEARFIAGLKYLVMMLFIAWVTFRFFI